ncbi:MAG: hypothetical protein IJ201_07170 [Solobacterium sp.]|nr:hypothetical protein [Solobacterium sp.]
MRPRSPQQDRNLRLLTAGIILVLSVIPFIGLDPYTINYTGLFQQRPLLTWLCMGPALILQGWLFMTAIKKTAGASSLRLPSLILLIGVIGLMIMPYRKEHDLSTNLHLVLAFAVLVLLNVLVLKILFLKQKLLLFYAGGCVLSFFTALTASSINGLSELIYAAVLTITLVQAGL